MLCDGIGAVAASEKSGNSEADVGDVKEELEMRPKLLLRALVSPTGGNQFEMTALAS